MIPVKCPICEGKGIVSKDFYHLNPRSTTEDSNVNQEVICRACHGVGILWGWCKEEYDNHPRWTNWMQYYYYM